MRVPLGVIGIIYESRPNVTADAGALCLKAGNAAILRGGSESFHSSRAILACLQEGLRAAGLPEAAIQSLPTTDRAAVGIMLTMSEQIDVIVPRGGPSLIERVQQESRIPVLAHRDGICHVYLARRRRSGDGARGHAQRQDAPDLGLRRRRDAAGRSRGGRAAAAGRARGAARGRLRGARRARGPGDRPAHRGRRARPTGRPSIWMRSSRSGWSTALDGGDRAHQPLRLAPHRQRS